MCIKVLKPQLNPKIAQLITLYMTWMYQTYYGKIHWHLRRAFIIQCICIKERKENTLNTGKTLK